jgi:hypothetical protein
MRLLPVGGVADREPGGIADREYEPNPGRVQSRSTT